MGRTKVSLLRIALAIMFMFIAVGYANLTDELNINGSVAIEPINDIYISGVKVLDGNATDISHVLTTLSSEIILKDANSSVALAITIVNNSETIKVFNAVKYMEDMYSNPDIVFALDGISSGTAITNDSTDGKNSLTFNITFTCANSRATDLTLNSLLYFEFADIADWENVGGNEGGGGESGDGTGGDIGGEIVVGEDFMVLVIESLSSDKNSFGLNDKNKGDSVISKTRQQGILYSTDNIQGGNLKHFASEERNTHNLDFMYEYVSETEITLYIWRLSEVSKATIGTTEITVFKQPHHLINGVWEKSTAMEGSAIIKRMKNNQSDYINAIIPSEWTIGAPVKS